MYSRRDKIGTLFKLIENLCGEYIRYKNSRAEFSCLMRLLPFLLVRYVSVMGWRDDCYEYLMTVDYGYEDGNVLSFSWRDFGVNGSSVIKGGKKSRRPSVHSQRLIWKIALKLKRGCLLQLRTRTFTGCGNFSLPYSRLKEYSIEFFHLRFWKQPDHVQASD